MRWSSRRRFDDHARLVAAVAAVRAMFPGLQRDDVLDIRLESAMQRATLAALSPARGVVLRFLGCTRCETLPPRCCESLDRKGSSQILERA